MSERITNAAVIFEGVTYLGRNHASIIHYIVEKTKKKPVIGCQGFYTSNKRFVDRKEAAEIALASGQVKENYHILFSEDVEMPEQEVKEALDKL